MISSGNRAVAQCELSQIPIPQIPFRWGLARFNDSNSTLESMLGTVCHAASAPFVNAALPRGRRLRGPPPLFGDTFRMWR
jgi:hypothetical protein